MLLIAALVVDVLAPPLVHGGPATLEFLQARKTTYVAEQIPWILPNILPVIVFTTLGIALWPVDRSFAWLGHRPHPAGPAETAVGNAELFTRSYHRSGQRTVVGY